MANMFLKMEHVIYDSRRVRVAPARSVPPLNPSPSPDFLLPSDMSPAFQMILDNALDAIGHTPLIRLDKLAQTEGLKCNLRTRNLIKPRLKFDRLPFAVGKTEFVSAGGSVKDRIAKRMVLEAEKDHVLIPGKSIVIEPTSGNTGVI